MLETNPSETELQYRLRKKKERNVLFHANKLCLYLCNPNRTITFTYLHNNNELGVTVSLLSWSAVTVSVANLLAILSIDLATLELITVTFFCQKQYATNPAAFPGFIGHFGDQCTFPTYKSMYRSFAVLILSEKRVLL